ncbi:ATP-dependent RNA helicase [Spraguea lophii 42_110]|uniref:ATP-dependent RNA helicase n=1 Tax=Spraguea lophii (strain 42_110) TaxID=1358809 RepID=S7W6P5_SPRLO|nr:ATP-dependent RNA helicase [Spraguea lophii 42_110]
MFLSLFINITSIIITSISFNIFIIYYFYFKKIYTLQMNTNKQINNRNKNIGNISDINDTITKNITKSKNKKYKKKNNNNSKDNKDNKDVIDNKDSNSINNKDINDKDIINNTTNDTTKNINDITMDSKLSKLLTKLKVAEDLYGVDLTSDKNNMISTTDKCTADVNIYKDKKWNVFNLDEKLIKNINNLGFIYPSPVQYKAIPHSLENEYMVVRAKNGTGKTAAYLIPMIQNIINRKIEGMDNDGRLYGIILVPTRELALQVSKVAKRLSYEICNPCINNTHNRISIISTFGGTNIHEDIIRLKKGVDIIVCTLGRIVDLVEKRVIDFSSVVKMVFDEADKMLSVEFQKNIKYLIRLLSMNKKEKIILELYSATFPSVVKDFVSTYMHNICYINLMKELSLIGIYQFYALVDIKEKLHCLKTLLNKIEFKQCIIFCNNVNNVELLAMKVTDMGFPSYYIHSKMKQEERNKVFHNFSESYKYNQNNNHNNNNSISGVRADNNATNMRSDNNRGIDNNNITHNHTHNNNTNHTTHNNNNNTYNNTYGCKILVCSDLVTRGIDNKNVNLVINFEFPYSSESYLHRIGRSGRFGGEGIAISFVVEKEKNRVIEVENGLGIEILPVSDPSFNKRLTNK